MKPGVGGTLAHLREMGLNLSENGNVLKLKRSEIFHKAFEVQTKLYQKRFVTILTAK